MLQALSDDEISGVLAGPVIDYMESRGISQETLMRARITSGGLRGSDRDWINFPYFNDNGEIYSYKYRDTLDKRFTSSPGSRSTFFLSQLLDPNVPQVVLTVGETDALSLLEAGVPNSLSLPNGDQSFGDVLNSSEIVTKAKRIIIAGDNDASFRKVRDELARRLGKFRCWIVEWPAGIKDANEYLLAFGPEALKERISEAAPVPVEGLYQPRAFKGRLLELYNAKESRGFDTGLPTLDAVYSIPMGYMTVITGMPNHGKALALDTPLPTPSGWTTMGEVKVGDELFGSDGQICSVKRMTEVQLGRPCFKLTFSNGEEIVADADHKWVVDLWSRHHGKAGYERAGKTYKKPMEEVFSTIEMVEKGLKYAGKNEFRIKRNLPINLPKAELPIDPYVLGVWLGDGTSSKGAISSADDQVWEEIQASGYSLAEAREGDISRTVYGMQPILRQLDVLNNKHIPAIYLRGSVDQRLALLQGLCDSDGYATHEGRCEFTNINGQLAADVVELARSLGLHATTNMGVATLYGRNISLKFRVMIAGALPVFRLKRKLDRYVQTAPRSNFSIRAIERIPSVPVKCIEVDSDDHTYLCSYSMLPTHNTSFLNQLLVHQVVKHRHKVAVWGPETDPALHTAQLMELYSGMPFFPGYDRRMSAEEVEINSEWVDRNFLYIHDPDEPSTIDSILDRAAAAIQRSGIRILVIDPFNNIARGESQFAEHEHIKHMLSKTRRFARSHEIHVFFIAHPRTIYDDRIPDGGSISGGIVWNAMTDFGITIHQVARPERGPGGPGTTSNQLGLDGNRLTKETLFATNLTEAHIWKVRNRQHGRKTKKDKGIQFEFDQATGRFSPAPVWDEDPGGDFFRPDAPKRGLWEN